MTMRDFVSGRAACGVPPDSSSSNPVGALANALIGSSSKTQQWLKEIPTATASTNPAEAQFYLGPDDRFQALPGTEFDQPFSHPNTQASEFLCGFCPVIRNALADAWDEIQHSHLPPPQAGIPQLDDIYGPDAPIQPALEGPPQRVLSSFLCSFVASSHGGVPFRPTPLPLLGLSKADIQCIRERSSIMARHFFADKSEDFINSQVNALLSSLDFESGVRVKAHVLGRFQEYEDYWNESLGSRTPGPCPDGGWIPQFSQQKSDHVNPHVWTPSFGQQDCAAGWVSVFEREQLVSVDKMRGSDMSHLAAAKQTHSFARKQSHNNDPTFQLSCGPDQWGNQFTAKIDKKASADHQLVTEFSNLHVADPVNEFGKRVGEGTAKISAGNWANAHDNNFGNNQLSAKRSPDDGSRIYVTVALNPYLGHFNPFEEGQDLFHKGLLGEARLALEAEVDKHVENSEGWRLLGMTHTEKDDEQQAMAALNLAYNFDPKNLEVLVALAASYIDGQEPAAGLKFLNAWLCHHPLYWGFTPKHMCNLYYAEEAGNLWYTDVLSSFNELSLSSWHDPHAHMGRADADVHMGLGLLYSLSREYDKAISSFQTALKLKPQDYLLWNMLGEAQAKSSKDADAILAFQQALNLRPSYVRPWRNMGLCYASQGMYEDSIRCYVQALAMNLNVDITWRCLRFSLSCASRIDMLEACDSRNLDTLLKAFPL